MQCNQIDFILKTNYLLIFYLVKFIKYLKTVFQSISSIIQYVEYYNIMFNIFIIQIWWWNVCSNSLENFKVSIFLKEMYYMQLQEECWRITLEDIGSKVGYGYWKKLEWSLGAGKYLRFLQAWMANT